MYIRKGRCGGPACQLQHAGLRGLGWVLSVAVCVCLQLSVAVGGCLCLPVAVCLLLSAAACGCLLLSVAVCWASYTKESLFGSPT